MPVLPLPLTKYIQYSTVTVVIVDDTAYRGTPCLATLNLKL